MPRPFNKSLVSAPPTAKEIAAYNLRQAQEKIRDGREDEMTDEELDAALKYRLAHMDDAEATE
jgi:hypothetical protein